jgi:hypothetical protein
MAGNACQARARCRDLAVALFILLAVVLAERARAQEAQAPGEGAEVAALGGPPAAEAAAEARSISFNAQVIEASNPPRPEAPDPRLAPLVAELKRLFQFTQYKLLGTPSGMAALGQVWQAPLPGGVTLQATPTAVEPAGIQVQVRLLRGAALVVNSTVRVASGGQVLVGGTPSPQGTLIVALQARAP